MPSCPVDDLAPSPSLGRVRGTTNSFSTWVEPMAYTAFGERITGTQNSYMTRVGYVGAHGYQSTPIFETTPHADIGYLHVGARYYDPASGRFLQRDPIGMKGGLNTYSYVDALPTSGIDALGLWRSEMRPDQRELEKKQREETDRIRADRERRQREENRRLNTTPYPYEDMQRTIRRTKQAQWILKVPAHIVSWASLWTPAGWAYKATGTGVSTCSFLIDGYDLFLGP